jgi:cytochrome c oxidase subunit II
MPPPRKTICVLGVLGVASAACAPRAGDAEGRSIGDLYNIFAVIAAVIFVTTAGLIAWSIIRYRARPEDDELPAQRHTNVPLEIVWFAIPQIIVIVLFILSIRTLGRVDEADSSPAVTVRAQGFQWGWRFTYEDDGVVVAGNATEPPEMVLPVGEKVAFLLVSDDVVHSFYVPEFLMKRDTIPGRTNRFDVTIDDEGTYDGKCAEFCGLLHASMNFRIRAVSPGEFEDWLAEQSQEL